MANNREIAEAEVSSLLRRGGYVKAYTALVRQRQREAVKVPKTTVAQRKQRLREAIDSFDVAKLAELQAKSSALIDAITSNIEVLQGKGILDSEEAFALMEQLLGERDITELLEVSREMIKRRVFDSLTEEFATKGVEDPENQNGSIPVPELGKRFARENCGLKDAVLDEEKLKKLLGDRRWRKVCDVEVVPAQVIPEHTEYTLNIENLMKLAAREPAVLESIRESLEVSGWKTPRFVPRDL